MCYIYTMDDINIELIQFFKEQARSYDFLLHRTRKEQDALSILENGLYFEGMLTKVTDSLREFSALGLMGNKMFFEPYGSYIIIIAIAKEIKGKYNEIAVPVKKSDLSTLFTTSVLTDFDDMYHLSPRYIMAYNVSFGRKLKFNRHFFESRYQGAA